MQVEKIFHSIEDNWDTHLKRYQKYVRQPSVSGSGLGVRDMAQLLCEELKDLGCQDVRLVETEGWPVVYGALDEGAPKTLLIYGMYDVQPVDGEKWCVDPFSGSTVNDPKRGEMIVSRGIRNEKGPLAALMNVLETIRSVDHKLPVNIKFIIEGEEELGSVHLPGVIEQLRPELETCDFCYFPHFSQEPNGSVQQFLGYKGITHLKLTCKGGDWGGPTTRSIHGANAIWFDNPIWKLVHVLNTLKDENEHVLVEGFYDDVAGPLEGDEELVDQLMETFDPQAILDSQGVKKFKMGLSGRALLERFFFMPELNIDGIVGGFYGEGSKTLLPNEAYVNMDIRTVPNMDPQKIISLFQQHFKKLGLDGIVTAEFTNAYNWSRSKKDEPVVVALINAIREIGYEPEIWCTVQGSAPLSLFQSMLHLPVVFGGLGNGHLEHSPNEYAIVSSLKEMEKCIVLFLRNIADS